jgi:hypothetical protein
MTDDTKRTWHLAARDAREAALEAIEYGDDRDADDMAHEYADGSADTFTYWHALCIYTDSSHVSDYVDDAADIMGDDARTPEAIAGACVYLALRDEYRETVEGLREDATHGRSILANAARMRERVARGNEWVAA